jgi:serine/threonine protein kinase/formylglycine-generating enzyme required for sulfatase activity
VDPRRRHEHLQDLLLQARDLSGAKREEFLEESCGDDAELRGELEVLLAHDRHPITFLDDSRRAAPGMPHAVGPFRVRSKLGEGGMGAVYEAEQEQPHRTVALKVLRPSILSSEALRRFELEGEVLGRLQHPGIAQIYASGRDDTEEGPRPYFAMELVRGEPLSEFARSHDLSRRDRLELVAGVADAVQHAHQHGVIHRDLKPQNVLVDGNGRPKVLDFGIARASDADLQVTTLRTDVGQILGTLAYMSPEQASGDPAAIDSRTDVYSLGVILYELLVGSLPLDLSGSPPLEALRIIQEDDPVRPGTLDTSLRGDLETIVGKALEKDKERRYPSAAALAADIRHHLEHEPIEARPPTRLYTLRKFVRRNRSAVVGAALVFLSLLVGLVVSLRFGLGEAEKRREVLELSALQDLEDLLAHADALWPAVPEHIEAYESWVDDARALVARLPEHRTKLAALRARALPRTDAERSAQRARHPAHAELTHVEGRIAFLSRQLARRRDGERTVLPAPDWGAFPANAGSLRGTAWNLVDPFRERFGEEALGLALARRALELAPEETRHDALRTLAWAQLAVGDDDDALNASFEAFETATDDRKPSFEEDLARLEAAVDAASTEEWIRATEEELAGLEACRAELEPRVDARSDWSFPEEEGEARWWCGQLAKLVDGLAALEAAHLAEDGWGVSHRLAFARELRDGSAPGGTHARLWADAAEGIAAAYPDLALAPQLGLVPLGPDPTSGLWEFAHLMTGEVPARDGADELVLTEETALVLVLLPGGTFHMGAQAFDPAMPNHDPLATFLDGPVHEVTLEPFFLSKYEMTQGQWLAFAGANPSYVEEGRNPTRLHPVEQVSWSDCTLTLARLGLALPTEAQWEYGARAGTTSVYWTGDGLESLRGAANIADQSIAGVNPELPSFDPDFPFSDGFQHHAPVGTFRPNPFGLHEVHGNVTEWCSNAPGYYPGNPALSPGDRRLRSGAQYFRCARGGSFLSSAAEARSAHRFDNAPDFSDYRLGVRPARAVAGALR